MNLTVGTIIKFEEAIFTGSYKKPEFSHTATHVVRILRESYGARKGQHSFSLEVIESTERNKGGVFRKMGRNIYPTAQVITYPDDHEDKVADKEYRANIAKESKYLTWVVEAAFEGKMRKLDRIPLDWKKENRKLIESYGIQIQ